MDCWIVGLLDSWIHGLIDFRTHRDHEPIGIRSAAVWGTSRSSHERCNALRLVFDTAALRRRFMERSLFLSDLLTAHEPAPIIGRQISLSQRA